MNKFIQTMISAAFAGSLAFINCYPVNAASLDTNLLVDPGFENVNTGVNSGDPYFIPLLVDWTGPGYAQAHGTSGWANGDPLAGGDTYYYGGNHAISQEIDLSSGDTATVISTGGAEFDMNGWFSGFSSQIDYATMFVTFEDSGGSPLGSPYNIIGTPATWSLESTTGSIPIGTETAVISFTQTGGGWIDGYVDNAYFDVYQGVIPLTLLANTVTGELTVLNNDLLTPVEFDFYEILSSGNSLDAVSWNSFDDQGLDAIGGGPTQSWGEGAGSGTDILTEAFLLGSTTIGVGESETLGNGYDESVDAQDLIFNYGNSSTGKLLQGIVSYVDTNATFLLGDFNGNGSIGLEDYQIMKNFWFTDNNGTGWAINENGELTGPGGALDGRVDIYDFMEFRTNLFPGGASAFAEALAEASAVPEPSTLSLAVVLLMGLAIRQRWRV